MGKDVIFSITAESVTGDNNGWDTLVCEDLSWMVAGETYIIHVRAKDAYYLDDVEFEHECECKTGDIREADAVYIGNPYPCEGEDTGEGIFIVNFTEYRFGMICLRSDLRAPFTLTVYQEKEDEDEEPTMVYGVEWDYSQSSTKLTRTDSSGSFQNPSPATDLASAGTSPFDNVLPWSGMVRKTIGADEMVYIPEFYFRVEDDPANSKMKWQITSKPKEGFMLHPGSRRYISRYHASTGCASVSGQHPIGSLTRDTFRKSIHAKGENWWMTDIATWSALQILYLVEYADWDSQSALGMGQSSGYMRATGETDTAVYHTIKRDGASNQYRWIENPYSNIRNFIDGMVCDDRRVYVGTDNATFGDTVAGYTDTGITVPFVSGGRITTLSVSDVAPWMFIPADASDSISGAHIPDLFTSKNTGNTIFISGGNSTVSDDWGLFAYDTNDYASFTSESCGSRMIYIPSEELEHAPIDPASMLQGWLMGRSVLGTILKHID